MKKYSPLWTASLLALLLSGPAGPLMAAEPADAPGGPAEALEGLPGGKAHRFLEALQEGGPNRESYGDVVLRHMDVLKLSDEQIGRILRIHEENQRKIKELGRKLRELRKFAYELFLNPASDEPAIRKVGKDHNAAFDELVDTALKSRAAINAVLSPEQLSQLKSRKTSP